VRLDESAEAHRLNAHIDEVNQGLADDLQALKDLEALAEKVAEVTDKLARVARKIAERAV
jgi:hypothetical protein